MRFGESLFANNGTVELMIPLTYGLRISHFSFCEEENVFYEQPEDRKALTTEAGWNIRGGHRLWVAPESENVYYPDNERISYEVLGKEIIICQKEDPWLHVKKSMRISFEKDNGVRILHQLQNTGSQKMKCSLWAITAMAPGGIEQIPLALREGGMDPWHRISLWDYTSLGDRRAAYTREEIRLSHLAIDEKYKIGVGHPCGPIRYENRGIVFEKDFSLEPGSPYPDGDVSYETFLCKYMVEMESLSPYTELLPGETREHEEIWRLYRKKWEGETI